MPISHFTRAIKASAPDLPAWVNQTFTASQLAYIRKEAGREGFRPPVPLDDVDFAARVFRSYRAEAVFALQAKFDSLDHFANWRCPGWDRDSLHAEALICAIALLVHDSPHLVPGREHSGAIRPDLPRPGA